jgi:hypothetical protein
MASGFALAPRGPQGAHATDNLKTATGLESKLSLVWCQSARLACFFPQFPNSRLRTPLLETPFPYCQPDARRLRLRRRPVDREPRGGDARRLTTGLHATDPAISPDGTQLAFTGEAQGNQDVYVMPAAGGSARRLTHGDRGNQDAPWMILRGSVDASRFREVAKPLAGSRPQCRANRDASWTGFPGVGASWPKHESSSLPPVDDFARFLWVPMFPLTSHPPTRQARSSKRVHLGSAGGIADWAGRESRQRCRTSACSSRIPVHGSGITRYSEGTRPKQ